MHFYNANLKSQQVLKIIGRYVNTYGHGDLDMQLYSHLFTGQMFTEFQPCSMHSSEQANDIPAFIELTFPRHRYKIM